MKSLTKKMEMMNHDFELYWVKNREVHFDPFLTRRVQKTWASSVGPVRASHTNKGSTGGWQELLKLSRKVNIQPTKRGRRLPPKGPGDQPPNGASYPVLSQ